MKRISVMVMVAVLAITAIGSFGQVDAAGPLKCQSTYFTPTWQGPPNTGIAAGVVDACRGKGGRFTGNVQISATSEVFGKVELCSRQGRCTTVANFVSGCNDIHFVDVRVNHKVDHVRLQNVGESRMNFGYSGSYRGMLEFFRSNCG